MQLLNKDLSKTVKLAFECLKLDRALDGLGKARNFCQKREGMFRPNLGKLIPSQHLGSSRGASSEKCGVPLVVCMHQYSTTKTDAQVFPTGVFGGE